MTKSSGPAIPPRGAGHCDDDAAWAKFVRQYDGQPRRLDMTDFALANRVFMADRNDLDLIVWQTAAKERIRWLSIELAKAQAALAEERMECAACAGSGKIEEAPAEAGERDYPAEFEAWWATYRHRNRDVADYSVKKQIAFDAFYHAALRARSSAPEAREGEAVGVVYSLKADLNTAELPDGTLLYTHPAHPSADHAELTRVAEAAGEEALGNLLAVIHGDGGHRALEVGTKQAALEAEKIVAGLFAAPSADKLRKEVTRDQIMGVVRQYAAPAWCSVDRMADALVAIMTPAALAAREDAQPVALPTESAPRDGTMLRLRVRYEADNQDEAWTPLEDSEESWTIGFNNFDNTGVDRWQFVGWDWSQDYLLEATGGTVIGWLPFHTHPAPDALRVAVEALEKISNRRSIVFGRGEMSGQEAFGIATEALAALSALQAGQKGGS